MSASLLLGLQGPQQTPAPPSTTKQTKTNSSKNLEVNTHEILAEKSSQVDVRKNPPEVKQWCNGPLKIVVPPGPLTALASMPGSGKYGMETFRGQ